MNDFIIIETNTDLLGTFAPTLFSTKATKVLHLFVSQNG